MRLMRLTAVLGFGAILLLAAPAHAFFYVDVGIQVGDPTGAPVAKAGGYDAYVADYESGSWGDPRPGTTSDTPFLHVDGNLGAYASAANQDFGSVKLGEIGATRWVHVAAFAQYNKRGMAATFKFSGSNTFAGGFWVWDYAKNAWDMGTKSGKGLTTFTSDLTHWQASPTPYVPSSDYNPAEVVSGIPATTDTGKYPNFPAGTPRVWRYAEDDFPSPPGPTALDSSYFHAKIMLVNMPVEIDPDNKELFDEPGGIGHASARFVRTTTALGNLATANAALDTMVPGSANHYVSEVRNLNQIHLDDSSSQFASPAGVFLSDPARQDVGGNPGDYTAARIAGYIKVANDNAAGTFRTFALSSDDGYQVKIAGSTVFGPQDGGVNPSVKECWFPQIGGGSPFAWWPVEASWYNGTGGLGFELSSSAVNNPSFPTDFKILGTDANFPIYTRISAIPNAATFGGNTVGTPPKGKDIKGYEWNLKWDGPGDPPRGDGLRVQSAPVPGGAVASVDDAIAFMKNADSVGKGKEITSNILAFRDPQNSITGNFPASVQAFPHNTLADDDLFASRMSGLIYIPRAGTYTFSTNSDGGYQLRVGDKILGRRADLGNTAQGGANSQEGYFPQAGFYPITLYHGEGNGGANVELSVNPNPMATDPNSNNWTGSILQGTRNPATNGQQTDFTKFGSGQPQIYSVNTVATLHKTGDGMKLTGMAYVDVPALGMRIGPESWRLEKWGKGNQGLLAQYYSYPGGNVPTWSENPAVAVLQGSRQELRSGTFNMPDNFAYGSWGNLEDQFGARWTGYLNVPTTGTFSIHGHSDDRSWIFLDTNLDGNLEFGPGDPNEGAWDYSWDNISLAAGLHKVEFRSREWTGGEWARFEWTGPGFGWQDIPASYFQLPTGVDYDTWTTLASGTGDVLDLFNENLFPYTPTYGESGLYRLVAEFAGQLGMAGGDYIFIPEPATMMLLGAGLLALVRRRRQKQSA